MANARARPTGLRAYGARPVSETTSASQQEKETVKKQSKICQGPKCCNIVGRICTLNFRRILRILLDDFQEQTSTNPPVATCSMAWLAWFETSFCCDCFQQWAVSHLTGGQCSHQVGQVLRRVRRNALLRSNCLGCSWNFLMRFSNF